MKWIVGLDLGPRSSGAVHFARWLHALGGQELTGVHVLEQEHLLAVLRDHHLDEVLAGARAAADADLRRHDAAGAISTVEVVQALNAPEGLREAAGWLRADGIILGRAAARDQRALVRLGRIARRLLRHAAVPVVVVPPDMRGDDFAGGGPVIALTKLTDDSIATCRFAEEMARMLSRRLLFVHAVDTPGIAAAHYVAAASLQRLDAERRAEADGAMARWVESCGVRPDATEVLSGHAADEAVALAERRRAALVVAGSRHGGSTLDRLLVASTGSELAAAAACPVAIVPPAHG